MTLDRRNKVAGVLAVVLVPVMVYLLVANSRAAFRRLHPVSDSGAVASATLSAVAVSASPSGDVPAGLDPAVLKEQTRIAMQQPKRNPFSAIPLPVVPVSGAAAEPTQAVAAVPEVKPPGESVLVLDGIVFGKTADRRSAIINGKMLSEGKSVGGYTIVTINSGAVVLEKGTNRITLHPKL